jgi:hypothetical protein
MRAIYSSDIQCMLGNLLAGDLITAPSAKLVPTSALVKDITFS